jgi:flagellar P-ring protein FlgI
MSYELRVTSSPERAPRANPNSLLATRYSLLFAVLVLASAGALAAGPEIRVQDISRLQGQRTNKLMGYGLVVGLPGTGDGEKYLPTMRMLASMHLRYHSPILAATDVKGNKSVAIVTVETTIPENGAREGQALDVTVSAIGSAKSLAGGQLLTTPLQYVMFDPNDPATQQILALANGAVSTPTDTPTRGTIRSGAVLEADFLYSFIENEAITLVLDEGHADWTWAHVIARAVNHELAHPALRQPPGEAAPIEAPLAIATGPKTVVVRIPPYELGSPARFISAVRETPLFDLPEQAARVTINRGTKEIAFTATVKVSPTVIQIPGVGTVKIGKKDADPAAPQAATNNAGPIGFDELYETLTTIKVSPEQLIGAVEQLHASGALHAQLQYK